MSSRVDISGRPGMGGRVRILRFRPQEDAQPVWEGYDFPFRAGMTVLDVLVYLYEQVDSQLGFSYCCRNSHCGLCGLMINGLPGLACREPASEELTLAPLEHVAVERDLIVDRTLLEERVQSLRLFLERFAPRPGWVEAIPLAAQEKFKVVSRCVACQCCDAACPSLSAHPHQFAGPCALVLLARHFWDPRDDLNRLLVAESLGVERCTGCGRCSEVCPHAIRPGEVVAEFKAEVLRRRPGAPAAGTD